MGSTQLIDFTPADIDMIFAVSQENLNQGLTPMPTASGPPTWIVDLSQSGTATQVTFNITFADGATFNNNQLGRTFTQSVASGGPQWVVPYQVDLTIAKIDNLKGIPQWLKDRFAALNDDYGEVFDLSQVLLDLTTLAFQTGSTSPGIDLYDWYLILQGTLAYLQTNHGDVYTTPPSTGYAITHNGATPTQTPPTYTPTSVDFVILPNAALPGASALVFVFMINQRPFPPSPANAFVDVVLITDPAITPGVALVGAPNFVSFI
ncbi:uncharacterized protein FSUBG_13291 [Fusarium subglutinans]|uniref:Uncharacterized protein n=1 Tax=Gibberella subglutinans TaxID=42677 RepID=A0A8H5KY54_GIBSU|nr:uncharacterized protein FSUBG_13291 [Fusarium subglutinans]KAF5580886.1 hypothetical protein FSUBG_13291 [Fusarium subglutinans]